MNPTEFETVQQAAVRLGVTPRAVHNPDTKHEVADNLSTLEFTIAMLYSRDWTAVEIGQHLNLSERTIYNRIDGIYSKLGITNKKQLNQYMLK